MNFEKIKRNKNKNIYFPYSTSLKQNNKKKEMFQLQKRKNQHMCFTRIDKIKNGIFAYHLVFTKDKLYYNSIYDVGIFLRIR